MTNKKQRHISPVSCAVEVAKIATKEIPNECYRDTLLSKSLSENRDQGSDSKR